MTNLSFEIIVVIMSVQMRKNPQRVFYVGLTDAKHAWNCNLALKNSYFVQYFTWSLKVYVPTEAKEN